MQKIYFQIISKFLILRSPYPQSVPSFNMSRFHTSAIAANLKEKIPDRNVTTPVSRLLITHIKPSKQSPKTC